MRVFITGAAGLIGRNLVRALLARGDSVVAISRDVSRARGVLGEGVEVIQGNPRDVGDWIQAVNGCDAVVNLAGEPVAGRRWNERIKQEIMASRVETTRNVVRAIQESEQPPQVFISTSAAGFYGDVEWSTPVDESHPAGSGFLAELCQKWEAAARLNNQDAKHTDGVANSFASMTPSSPMRMNSLPQLVRTIILRISIVLDPIGGALEKMLPPFRLGLGGPMGSGQQPLPWIHIEDMVGMILWGIDNPVVEGVLNACAPETVTQRDFARTLGRVLHRPAFFPVPAFVLRLLFGEGASVLLTGQRMVPKRAGELGYDFKHTGLEGALGDLLRNR
jgi:uncharacterized protein